MSETESTRQRAAERFALDHPIEFSVPGEPTTGAGRVLDSSETGVRFVASTAIEPGTDVNLRLPPLRDGMPRLTRFASVVRCEPSGDGEGYTVACAYD